MGVPQTSAGTVTYQDRSMGALGRSYPRQPRDRREEGLAGLPYFTLKGSITVHRLTRPSVDSSALLGTLAWCSSWGNLGPWSPRKRT